MVLTISQIILCTNISMVAMAHHFPTDVAQAVSFQESRLDPKAVGSLKEQGLFQLRYEQYPMYSMKQLQDPYLNMELGISYLAKLRHTCVYTDDVNYLVCFNAGPSKAKKIKHPGKFKYVREVKKKMQLFASL